MPIPPNTSVTHRVRSDGAEDEYGIPAPEWTDVGSYAAFLEQTDEVEVTAGADVATSDWLLAIDGDPPISHRDRVVEGTRVFEVVGSPDVKRRPRAGTVLHAEIRLRLVI